MTVFLGLALGALGAFLAMAIWWLVETVREYQDARLSEMELQNFANNTMRRLETDPGVSDLGPGTAGGSGPA